jgi:hypothetical protein
MPDDPVERFGKNADVCRHRADQALKPENKARWLKISEDWQKLAEEVDAANADRQGRKNSN